MESFSFMGVPQSLGLFEDELGEGSAGPRAAQDEDGGSPRQGSRAAASKTAAGGRCQRFAARRRERAGWAPWLGLLATTEQFNGV
ncbi:MAG: hypothetical protein CW345_06270 [Firmicutes bacterium]|nr:hypothetical protein [Bacillota bacterium]MBO2521392.1 hypothetical protein [Bacillota bacterium]